MNKVTKKESKREIISKEENAGFSLMELTVVAVILGIMASLLMPSFLCFMRRGKSTAAQVAMRAIKQECQDNFAYGYSDTYTPQNLQGYEITSSGGPNSCTGVVSALPTDTSIYPTYKYQSSDGELSYMFRGQTGTSLNECNKMICDAADADLIAK